MDGLCRVAGSLIDVALAGEEYFLRPLTLRDFGTVEFHLLARQLSPMDAVAKVLPLLTGQRDAQRKKIEQARQLTRSDARFVRKTWDDVLTWIDTPEGVVFTAWLCLLAGPGRQPLGTLRAARELFAAASEAERAEFVRRRNIVSCLDETSAADWRPRKGQSEDKKPEQYSPWKATAAQLLSEVHAGWTLGDFGDLTLYQLRLARADESEFTGFVKMSQAEYRAWKAKRDAAG